MSTESLKSFAFERDEILRQTMIARTNLEKLDKACKEAEAARQKALIEKIDIEKELQVKVDFIFDLLAKLEERIKKI